MRPLIITPEIDARCKEIRDYAFENFYTMDALRGVMILGAETAPGTDQRFRTIIPIGYRCVFTVEEQPEPVGMCTHISVSVDGPKDALPNPIAVTEIQRTFGLTNEQITNGFIHAWLEPIEYDPGQAINILNKVEITEEWKEQLKERRKT